MGNKTLINNNETELYRSHENNNTIIHTQEIKIWISNH